MEPTRAETLGFLGRNTERPSSIRAMTPRLGSTSLTTSRLPRWTRHGSRHGECNRTTGQDGAVLWPRMYKLKSAIGPFMEPTGLYPFYLDIPVFAQLLSHWASPGYPPIIFGAESAEGYILRIARATKADKVSVREVNFALIHEIFLF